MSSWLEIAIPLFCSFLGAAVTFYVQYRREQKRDEEVKAKDEEVRVKCEEQKAEIVELELTQGELSDCVARYMRDHPDSEIFHRIRTSERVTRVTNIDEAVLYVRKHRKARGIETKRIEIQRPPELE